MVQKKIQASKKCTETAIAAINTLLDENLPVSVSALVRMTGLSRSFYYTNQIVHDKLIHAQSLQHDNMLFQKRQKIFSKTMEKEIELLHAKINRMAHIIEKKEMENSNLKKALSAEREKHIALL